MKITDEIDKIKKQGIENVEYNSDGTIAMDKWTTDEMLHKNTRSTKAESFLGEPFYTGDYYPEEFGESKYDKNIPN